MGIESMHLLNKQEKVVIEALDLIFIIWFVDRFGDFFVSSATEQEVSIIVVSDSGITIVTHNKSV